MKQLFHITGHQADVEASDVFLAEVGEEYGCFVRYNSHTRAVAELEYFTFNKFTLTDSVKSLLGEIENAGKFAKVILCSAFPQAILTPAKFYHEAQNADLLKGIYDTTNCQVLHDEVDLWQMMNVFAVPNPLYETFNQAFSNTEYMHVYSTLLKSFDRFSDDTEMTAHFTSANFRIKIKRGRQLLLAQTFTYTTPLDVVYVLLKACTELRLKREETYIILSGLIDEKSTLYKELYHYFMHLDFAGPSAITLPGNQYPPHFFTSIANLITCAL